MGAASCRALNWGATVTMLLHRFWLPNPVQGTTRCPEAVTAATGALAASTVAPHRIRSTRLRERRGVMSIAIAKRILAGCHDAVEDRVETGSVRTRIGSVPASAVLYGEVAGTTARSAGGATGELGGDPRGRAAGVDSSGSANQGGPGARVPLCRCAGGRSISILAICDTVST